MHYAMLAAEQLQIEGILMVYYMRSRIVAVSQLINFLELCKNLQKLECGEKDYNDVV